MCPIRKILVPVDFSPNSGRALARAMNLATQLGAALEVLHVAEGTERFDEALLTDDQAPKSFRDRAIQAETIALSLFVETIPHAESLCVRKTADLGRPCERILEHAQRGKHDLIVVGRHGTSGRVDGLTGSVAQSLARDAQCPVLTVGASDGASDRHPPLLG